MDLAEAKRAIRFGAAAALVSALLTFVVVLAATMTGMPELAVWNDPANFVDVALLLGLAYGVFRRSRAAGVFLLLYFVASRVLIIAETGNLAGIFVSAIFLYLIGRATWGTFVYRRAQERDEHARRKAGRWVIIYAGAMAVVVFVVLIGLGGLIEAGVIPDSAAVPGDQLTDHQLNSLRDAGLVRPEEEILYFYSDGFFSILDDGNFFTNERVVSYAREDDSLLYESARFSEITDLGVEFADGFLENTNIVVTTADGREFLLWVSNESGRDSVFVRMLTDSWQKKRR